MDDRIAISRVKQGDLSGLDVLVRHYQARAVQAAYAILFDRALAEDVAQTAFLKVMESVQQFDEERPFAPWFFRIVVNDAIKAAKKRKTFLPLEEETDESTAQLVRWLADPGSGPEEILEQKQTRENILKALQYLSPEQRAVIVMQYFLEMSEADMVLKMDRPLSTIKWWLREARNQLRKRIRSSQMEDGR